MMISAEQREQLLEAVQNHEDGAAEQVQDLQDMLENNPEFTSVSTNNTAADEDAASDSDSDGGEANDSEQSLTAIERAFENVESVDRSHPEPVLDADVRAVLDEWDAAVLSDDTEVDRNDLSKGEKSRLNNSIQRVDFDRIRPSYIRIAEECVTYRFSALTWKNAPSLEDLWIFDYQDQWERVEGTVSRRYEAAFNDIIGYGPIEIECTYTMQGTRIENVVDPSLLELLSRAAWPDADQVREEIVAIQDKINGIEKKIAADE